MILFFRLYWRHLNAALTVGPQSAWLKKMRHDAVLRKYILHINEAICDDIEVLK